MVEVERGFDLSPKPTNKKCEHCKKSFYANEDKQRGSKRRFCSEKCRNAAYFERRTVNFDTLKYENQTLRAKVARLSAEIERLKGEPKQLTFDKGE
jgi:hypothetical protein